MSEEALARMVWMDFVGLSSRDLGMGEHARQT